jgi:hypothetical protein
MRNYVLLWREHPVPAFVDIQIKWDSYAQKWGWDVAGSAPADKYGWAPISRITGYGRNEKSARRQAKRASKAILGMKPFSKRYLARVDRKVRAKQELDERKRKTFTYRIPPE